MLLAGSTLVALPLAEFSIRLTDLVPPVHAIWLDDEDSFYGRSSNPVLGHEIKPSFRRVFPAGTATSNAHGLRDRERIIDKPPGGKRVLLLGDSVVEGINYVADDQTISHQLEELFQGDSTEVLNVGTSGYCTRAEVELLKQKGLQFSPDTVVLVFVFNDFRNFNPEHTTAGGVIERPLWSKKLFVASDLFRLLCLRFNWFEFAGEADPNRRNQTAIGENNVVDGLAMLRNLANEHGFSVLVAVWPMFRGDDIVDSRVDAEQRLLIERLAAMNGFPVVRLSQSFRRDRESLDKSINPRQYYTVREDGMHPSEAGGAVAARALKSALEGPIPPPPYPSRTPDTAAIEVARELGGMMPPARETGIPEERVYRSLRYQGRIEEAQAYLQRVLEGDADNAFALFKLGANLISKEQSQREGSLLLQRLLKITPEHIEARLALAQAHLDRSEFQKAGALLQEGVKISPGSALLQFGLGLTAATQKNWAVAEQHLMRALELDSDYSSAKKALRDVRRELHGD